jgi:hypothetical protein
MAITSTTLSGALTASQTTFTVASTTNITAPVLTTGSGITWLYVEAELMFVTAVPVSGTVQATRGMMGTKAVAHLTSTPVIIGGPTDFPVFTPQVGAFQTEVQNRFGGVSAVVASSATIVAPAQFFHVSGGTAINIITPPANFVAGEVTIIFDSACTWTSSNVTNGISASGTSTTAGSAVKCYLDANPLRWYPERLA